MPTILLLLASPQHASSDIYTLSLHDALPISRRSCSRPACSSIPSNPSASRRSSPPRSSTRRWRPCREPPTRSEEHTSELQSHSDLVCRLLLEKKKEATDDY